MDSKSYEYAQRNVQANSLSSHIKVVWFKEVGQAPLLPADIQNFEDIDFVMTNPPFYASENEMLESAKKKQRPPNSACTGAPIEMITRGGEVEFVSKLILESMNQNHRFRIQWFTSMLGKLSSVSTLIERLRQKGCSNYAVAEFVQGQKDKEMGTCVVVAGLRPRVEVARGINGLEKRLLPFPSEFAFEVGGSETAALGARVDQHIKALDLQWQWKPTTSFGMGLARDDVWSRKARRRKKQRQDEDQRMGDAEEDEEGGDDGAEPALVFKISLISSTAEALAPSVNIRWMQGEDSVLFESFCGWLKRKVVSG